MIRNVYQKSEVKRNTVICFFKKKLSRFYPHSKEKEIQHEEHPTLT